MLHDPEDFPNPEVFNPDRYKNEDNEMQRVIDIAFGFGRRACPGYHFGMGTLFAIVLTTLATCDILPALDGNGKEIIPEVKYTSGIIRQANNQITKFLAKGPQVTLHLSV